MRGAGAAYPHAVEKSDDRGGAAGELAEHLASSVSHRLRTIDAAARQVLHQAQEERQIALGDAPFVERQNEMAAFRMDEEIRVFDAFGNALIRQQPADIVAGQKPAQIFRGDIGIDCHETSSPSAPAMRPRPRRRRATPNSAHKDRPSRRRHRDR